METARLRTPASSDTQTDHRFATTGRPIEHRALKTSPTFPTLVSCSFSEYTRSEEPAIENRSCQSFVEARLPDEDTALTKRQQYAYGISMSVDQTEHAKPYQFTRYWDELVAEIRTRVIPKEHRTGLFKHHYHSDCFPGSEVVQVLSETISSRPSINQRNNDVKLISKNLCQRFLDSNILYPVTQSSDVTTNDTAERGMASTPSSSTIASGEIPRRPRALAKASVDLEPVTPIPPALKFCGTYSSSLDFYLPRQKFETKHYYRFQPPAIYENADTASRFRSGAFSLRKTSFRAKSKATTSTGSIVSNTITGTLPLKKAVEHYRSPTDENYENTQSSPMRRSNSLHSNITYLSRRKSVPKRSEKGHKNKEPPEKNPLGTPSKKKSVFTKPQAPLPLKSHVDTPRPHALSSPARGRSKSSTYDDTPFNKPRSSSSTIVINENHTTTPQRQRKRSSITRGFWRLSMKLKGCDAERKRPGRRSLGPNFTTTREVVSKGEAAVLNDYNNNSPAGSDVESQLHKGSVPTQKTSTSSSFIPSSTLFSRARPTIQRPSGRKGSLDSGSSLGSDHESRQNCSVYAPARWETPSDDRFSIPE